MFKEQESDCECLWKSFRMVRFQKELSRFPANDLQISLKLGNIVFKLSMEVSLLIVCLLPE